MHDPETHHAELELAPARWWELIIIAAMMVWAFIVAHFRPRAK